MPMNLDEFFAAVERDKANGLHKASEQAFADAVADGVDHFPKRDWDKMRDFYAQIETVGRGSTRGFVGAHLDEPEPTPSP